jgi:NTP pyrophosphatase (non-canonical NTP hydrolase)
LEFDEYQSRARETAIYPNLGSNLWYPTLGLAGEAGEVAEKVKKIYRDSNGQITDQAKEKLKYELGDVLWYIANVAAEASLTLEQVAIGNLAKLNRRMVENQIHGSGDNR